MSHHKMHYKDKPYKKRIARIPKSKVKHFIVLFNKISDFYGSNVAAFNKLGISSNVYKEMRNGVLTSKMASIILTAHKKLPKDKS